MIQVDKARDLESSIKRGVETAVRERCDCDFSSTAIFSGEFGCRLTKCKADCDLGTYVTYRAVVNGTSDMLTAVQIIRHIETWRDIAGTFLHNVFRLELATKCRVEIDSFHEKECEET